MNIKKLSPEDKITHAKKSEMQAYESVTFICFILAVLFFSVCIRFYRYVDVRELISWVPLVVMGLLAILCAGLTVVSWRGADRSRKQLAKLKAVVAPASAPK